MKFRFIGEEPTLIFGLQWIKGTVHDVTDDHAVRKLSGSVLWEKVEGGGEEPKKRVGRPPKAAAPEQEH